MDIYRNLYKALEATYSTGEAQAIARMVMEEAFDLTMTDILMDKDSQLSANDLAKLEIITQRLTKGEPVQYVLGYTHFAGHTFKVAPGVLIPRPETEELVSLILSECSAPNLRVLDVGTGSGCIAISLALARPEWYVTAWDISAEALAIARSNAMALQAKVDFREQDALHTEGNADTYDIIVSNPPYICHEEADEMEQNVLDYEPASALFVPNSDPLLFYRAIAAYGRSHLSPGGRLYFEINRRFGPLTHDMLREMGYTDITLHHDQHDNPRMISARL